MFISRDHYDEFRAEREDLRSDSLVLRTENRVLSEQNTFLRTTLDWLRIRVTQLEIERAQLLFNFTGVKIPVPAIERETPPGPNPSNVSDILASVNHFDDIGDREAGKLGVAWNPDGTLHFQD